MHKWDSKRIGLRLGNADQRLSETSSPGGRLSSWWHCHVVSAVTCTSHFKVCFHCRMPGTPGTSHLNRVKCANKLPFSNIMKNNSEAEVLVLEGVSEQVTSRVQYGPWACLHNPTNLPSHSLSSLLMLCSSLLCSNYNTAMALSGFKFIFSQ